MRLLYHDRTSVSYDKLYGSYSDESNNSLSRFYVLPDQEITPVCSNHGLDMRYYSGHMRCSHGCAVRKMRKHASEESAEKIQAAIDRKKDRDGIERSKHPKTTRRKGDLRKTHMSFSYRHIKNGRSCRRPVYIPNKNYEFEGYGLA